MSEALLPASLPAPGTFTNLPASPWPAPGNPRACPLLIPEMTTHTQFSLHSHREPRCSSPFLPLAQKTLKTPNKNSNKRWKQTTNISKELVIWPLEVWIVPAFSVSGHWIKNENRNTRVKYTFKPHLWQMTEGCYVLNRVFLFNPQR